MIKAIFLLFILFNTVDLYSQELPEYIRAESKHIQTKTPVYEHHHHKLSEIQEYGEVERRNYDVLKYTYLLDLSFALNSELKNEAEERNFFTGSNMIFLKMLEDVEVVEFDAVNMNISGVIITYDGDYFPTTYKYNIDNGILVVDLPNYVKKDDSLRVTISFNSVADEFEDFRNNRGMHIYHKGMEVRDHRGKIIRDNKGDPAIVEHNIAYSMSEPELARYWIPCNDRPYDKALSSMTITVPIGYTAVSNGLLTKVDTNNNEFVTFYWDNNEPIPTYLMNFAASIFNEHKQIAIVENDTIPMLHYAWPEDMNGDYFKLIPSMDTHPLMMEVLTDNFGPYPFSRYGTVTVHPFPYGGMEHQTNVTQNRFWIRDNGDGGFVHEMGHHWFGNMITCATWADIWINEGGATFTEAMYFGEVRQKSEYKRVMEQKINFYLQHNVNNSSNSMYAVPINSFFGNEGFLIYEKGAIFLNQMKENLGEEQFYEVVRKILQEYKYKSITTDEYRQAWKEKAINPKVGIDLFFDQWVYGAGNPEYTMESNIDGNNDGKYKIEVDISQVQSENELANEKVLDLYITPIRFQYSNGFETGYSETFMNESLSQSYSFEADFLPTEVIIDQTSVVHFLKTAVITSVELEDYVGGIELFPNPATDNNNQLNLNIERAVQNARIELFDVLGNKVKDIYSGNLTNDIGFKINTIGLPSGIYIVNINLDGVSTSRKLIVQ